jgi:hypothetical protein
MDSKTVEKLLNSLQKRGFKAYFANNRDEIFSIVKNLIPKESTIGFGGSMTVEELGLPQFFDNNGYNTLHYKVRSDYDYPTLSKMATSADWMVTSSNAITENGEIVNTDGRANRIANIVYGPKNVLLIISANKIVKNLDEAFKRIKTVAAPKNCKRLNKNTPCSKDGVCGECDLNETICKATLILHHPTGNNVVHIIIINETLGY